MGAGSNVASGMEETARQIESGRIVNDEDYEAASTRLAAIGASEGLPFIGPAFRVMRRITGAAAKNPKAIEKLGDYIKKCGDTRHRGSGAGSPCWDCHRRCSQRVHQS